MYDAVISETDLKKINRALVPIQGLYGQVARLQLPFNRKQKMLEKLGYSRQGIRQAQVQA